MTKLERMGLRTIGDVAAPRRAGRSCARSVRVSARHLHALARNDDDRAVVPERDAKSIGAEETFGADLHTMAAVRARARAPRRPGVRASARRADSWRARSTSRSASATSRRAPAPARSPEATDVSTVVLDVARALLAEFDVGRGVRLLGVSLVAARRRGRGRRPRSTSPATRESDRRERTERRAAVERAVDEVRDRFGARAVGPATLVEAANATTGDGRAR